METTIMGLLGFRLILGLHSLYKILYPKRRIISYSLLGTIVSPYKILLMCTVGFSQVSWWVVTSKIQGAPECLQVEFLHTCACG